MGVLRAVIRIGDSTSHGGTVLECFPTLSVCGKNAAGVGHKVSCPLCQTTAVIVEGAQNFNYFDVPVAVEGMKTSCGAVLIASQQHMTVEISEVAAVTMPTANQNEVLAGTTSSFSQPARHEIEEEEYEIFYEIVDAKTENPIEGIA